MKARCRSAQPPRGLRGAGAPAAALLWWGLQWMVRCPLSERLRLAIRQLLPFTRCASQFVHRLAAQTARARRSLQTTSTLVCLCASTTVRLDAHPRVFFTGKLPPEVQAGWRHIRSQACPERMQGIGPNQAAPDRPRARSARVAQRHHPPFRTTWGKDSPVRPIEGLGRRRPVFCPSAVSASGAFAAPACRRVRRDTAALIVPGRNPRPRPCGPFPSPENSGRAPGLFAGDRVQAAWIIRNDTCV
jgi:hypothetical protein